LFPDVIEYLSVKEEVHAIQICRSMLRCHCVGYITVELLAASNAIEAIT